MVHGHSTRTIQNNTTSSRGKHHSREFVVLKTFIPDLRAMAGSYLAVDSAHAAVIHILSHTALDADTAGEAALK